MELFHLVGLFTISSSFLECFARRVSLFRDSTMSLSSYSYSIGDSQWKGFMICSLNRETWENLFSNGVSSEATFFSKR